MEPKQSLQRQSHDLTVSKTQSLQVSAENLAAELKLTALNAKTDLDEFLVTEFTRALVDLPAEAVRAAFRGWRDVSAFFPAISDIRQLAQLWVRRQAEAREEVEQAQRRQEVEAARERGELLEWPDVLKKFNDIVSREAAEKLENKGVMPEVPPNAEIVISSDRREMIRQQAEQMRAKFGTNHKQTD
jgi:hypothetical protein